MVHSQGHAGERAGPIATTSRYHSSVTIPFIVSNRSRKISIPHFLKCYVHEESKTSNYALEKELSLYQESER